MLLIGTVSTLAVIIIGALLIRRLKRTADADDEACRLTRAFEEKRYQTLSAELFALFMKHSPIYTYIKEVTARESRVIQVPIPLKPTAVLC